jgi:transposase InsO family protein
VILRLVYLAATHALTLLRLLPMGEREKEVEILVLRHQLLVLQRQVGRPVFTDVDRAILAGLLHHLPGERLGRLLLLGPPGHDPALAPGLPSAPACGGVCAEAAGATADRPLDPGSGGAPGQENPSRGYRRIHGELAALGIKVAASTVWEILREHGIPPAPERSGTSWADFLCSQAEALLACDLFEVRTLTGARLYVFAVIEHASRRVQVMGATAHPTAQWIVQLGRNLVMDLEDAGSRARFLIRDRDSNFTAAFDALLADAGLQVVTTGIRVPRMNSIMERWLQTCRRTPGPYLDLGSAPPPARAAGVRDVLQPASTASEPGTGRAARAAQRAGPGPTLAGPPTRPTGRDAARVPPCQLTRLDD